MMEYFYFKAFLVVLFLGATLYALHRSWVQAAGWLGFLTFFALLAALGNH